jgi:nicotinamide-nucleotide amidase
MEQVHVEILTIGDEILFGQIVDTNSQWLGVELSKAGFKVIRKTSVGDCQEHIVSALHEASSRAHVILTTGGLGPTKDDMTKSIFAEYFQVGMRTDEAVMQDIADLFKLKGREMNRLNKLQAVVPTNCMVIRNKLGTAPGMWFDEAGKIYVALPGVPHEMKEMVQNFVIPHLKERFHTPFICHKIIKTIGIHESVLAENIAPWEEQLPPHIRLAYLPRAGQVRLRLTATGQQQEVLEREILEQIGLLKPYVGKHLYGFDHDEIEVWLGKALLSKNYKLAVAESCTGGLLANQITNIPGCSAYFQGGIVAYSNEIKTEQLGVPREIIEQHGAVSEACARAMAEQVRHRYHADIGIATTGIAGPGGGTPEKPVGTVYIACSDHMGTEVRLLHLTSNRLVNINSTYQAAMHLVRERLLREGLPQELLPFGEA